MATTSLTTSFTIALAGNPNVGKSTIFNALTGSRQHVGNWPGKTVEKKEGRLPLDSLDIFVVDLPGTYSLTAYSIEEIISRDFIVHEQPDAVIAVVDAANLERNLYLVTQLLELRVPLILALNMSDIASKRGLKIDVATLSQHLNQMPIIETVGSDGIGIAALKQAIQHMVHVREQQPVTIAYGAALEKEITSLVAQIQSIAALTQHYNPRWLAVKLLEADTELLAVLEKSEQTALVTAAAAARERIITNTGEDAETLIADHRYAFIQKVVSGALTRPRELVETHSDKLDRVLTHRLYGVPIFLLMMWVVFQFTANVSAPFVDWVDGIIAGPFTNRIVALLSLVGWHNTWVESLLIDGIVAGVGGVLVFVPVLLALYFAIGVLEDSGYMARAAFVMDRVMRLMGLHGKSFLPMLVGFGCTVPAVYATRTLENEDDRRLTGFLVTFMSCGARLPVYVVIGAAFFGAQAGNLIFAMYLLGIAVALLTGFLMRRLIYRNRPPQPFVMELPPYRLPRLRDIARPMWERTRSFVRKAGTLIMTTSVIIWLLMAIPTTSDGTFHQVDPANSLFGTLSHAVAPVFAPAGFADWRAAGALVTGFVAKEVVIGTMSQIFAEDTATPQADEALPSLTDDVATVGTSFVQASVLTVQEIVNIVPRTVNIIPGLQMPEADFLGGAEDDDTTALETALTNVFTPLAAVAFTVFVLLYTPCMVTVAAMRHEFGLRWTVYQIVYTLLVAWLGAVLVFQIGTILGL
jgi:ferrous iron transport protein B